MTPVEVLQLRQRGARILISASWCITATLCLVAMTLGTGRALPIALIGIAANLLPTLKVLSGRVDRSTRLLIGTLAAIQPALLVFVLKDHPWQMDAHMYFFVALAALTILCDWRPIVLAATLIAVHHLLFEAFLPEWVFSDNGNLGRVVFHAGAVVLQTAMLTYLTALLRRLMQRQADARIVSEQAASASDARRSEVEAAMAASAAAQRQATEERNRRTAVEQEAEIARREDMRRLAHAFQETMAGIVTTVGTSARQMDSSAASLNTLAHRASEESTDSANNASRTSLGADALAQRLRDLSTSITAIAASAEQQARRSDDASSISAAGRAAVADLHERSQAITGFADSIHEIATRTNMLALNATIEAARAGDVGRGFAIVAHEVKLLASQTTAATDEIRLLANSMNSGAQIAQDALREIAAMVGDLATAADSIRHAVEEQRRTATAIDITAQDTASNAEMMAQQVSGVAALAGDTDHLSAQVAEAAGNLSSTARALDDATHQFVARITAG